jgi:hypothetical protein
VIFDDRNIAEKTLILFERSGAYLCSEAEKAKLEEVMFDKERGVPSMAIVGKTLFDADVDAQARVWATDSMNASRRAAAEAVNAGGGGGGDIVRYGDSAPGAVLDGEGTRVLANAAIQEGGPAMRFGLPVNAFDDARWHGYWASANDVKRNMGFLSLHLNRKVERMLKGLTPEENLGFIRAKEGIKLQPDGTLLQTAEDISPKINAIAIRYQHEITDKLFEVVTGIKPQAVAIIETLGLKDGEKIRRLLRSIQDSPQSFMSKTEAETAGGVAQFRGADIKIVSDAEMLAARRTAGMLNFGPTHDIRPLYEHGYFSHMPIPHEMALLQDQRESLEAMMAMGADSTKVNG